MKADITMEDWQWLQDQLEQVDYWQECPPFASFSMAGETHRLYLHRETQETYYSVSGNGFCCYYRYTDD